MMKYIQKLGKAMILPIAAQPICGILMGLGYLLCPAAMQGGEISGAVNLIGLFLVKAGGALIDHMALLFVVGVGVGMSDDNDGAGGVAAVVSWLMITTLLNADFVTAIAPSVVNSVNKVLAFEKIDNPFIGIIAGLIGSHCYNRFKGTQLPDWLSSFSGKRSAVIVAGCVSVATAVLLLFVWPLIFDTLISIGEGVSQMGAVGAGIYVCLNRLLIPTGLHHALNNVFWYDIIGLGDLANYWAGKTSADVTWSLGMYMAGFFPCMIFGIPGAALAMIHSAKNKKAATGLLASAAICSFVCGVTEPFEFCFMFLAPRLYLVYALLFGIFTVITVLVGFRAGFCFSAGAVDLVFSASLPAAANTWMILPLGIAAFATFYIVFRLAIGHWNLKTPGREEEDTEELNAGLTTDDYAAVAALILEGVGGKENVIGIDNCIVRLRLEIKNPRLINERKIKLSGVPGIMRPGKNNVHVVIGPQVEHVTDEFKRLCK